VTLDNLLHLRVNQLTEDEMDYDLVALELEKKHTVPHDDVVRITYETTIDLSPPQQDHLDKSQCGEDNLISCMDMKRKACAISVSNFHVHFLSTYSRTTLSVLVLLLLL